jgi:hypothetical protein
MKKRTLKEVEENERSWSGRACALAALVKTLSPSPGWRFTASPRGFEAWIFFVDDSGHVDVYSAQQTDTERETRAYEMRRAHTDSPYFASLCAALDEERRYIAHASTQACVPFAQSFQVRS